MNHSFKNKLFVILTLLALFFSSVGTSSVSAAGGPLVAKWSLDGNYTDSSANGYNGTLYQSGGYPAYSTDVPTGGGSNSLQFNGNYGYGRANLGNEIAGNHTFTVSFWMKYIPSAHRQWVMWMGNPDGVGSPDGGIHWLIDANGQANIGVFNGGGNTSFSFTPYANQWVKVTTVYYSSANRFSTYVNGELMDSDSASSANLPSSTPVMMGYALNTFITGGGDTHFIGYMDELEIYDCVYNVTVFNSNDSGTDSLRQAIADVCDGGTITFHSDLSGQTITLTSGELAIAKNLTIDGSALASQVTISGNNASRVFNISSGYTVTLNSLTISNGAGQGGGGILNQGALTVTNSSFLNNDGNVGGNAGGAIWTNNTLNVSNSTFSGNHARTGGALAINSGTTTVTNSTFTGNSAVGAGYPGGAIVNNGTGVLWLRNNTFSANTSASGTATSLWHWGGNPTTHLINNIMANGALNRECEISAGSIGTNTKNLMEGGGYNCGVPAFTSDPLLNALAPNGGPTQTMSLQTGSPALGAGDVATCAASPVNNLDQRGEARPQGDAACDIGAYESNLSTSHTVTFYGNGGGGSMSPQTSSSGTNLNSNTFTPLTGYSFAGWDTSPAGTTVVYAENAYYDFSADIDLYAVWTINTYTVTYNANNATGGSAPSSQSKTHDVDLTLATNTGALVRTGYTFNGWNTAADGNGTHYNAGATYTANAPLTLFAEWAVNSYTVSFDAQGGSPTPSNQSVAYGSLVSDPGNPTLSGYTFIGWFSAPSGGSQWIFASNTMGTSDMTLYAQWTALPTYTVIYNGNGSDGGSLPTDGNNYLAGATVNVLFSPLPTRTGYTFAGWSDGVTTYTSAGTTSFSMPASNVTLNAQWSINNHTVTFDANGGTGTMSPQTSNVPAALTNNAFARAGYTFGGWNTAADGSGTAFADGATYPFDATTTLFAQWNPTPTFLDVPFGFWAYDHIELIHAAGITSGCGGSNYCPNAPVTRAQMAIFLLRGMYGSSYTPPAATGTVFNDVGAGSFAAAWIEQLAAEGISSGCGGGNFCPNQAVTRTQMAVFLLRAEHGSGYTPPAATGTFFNDVSAGAFGAAWVEQLVSEGVTSGCGNGDFCPNSPVTRDQMAVFLVRIFNLP